MHVGNVWGAMCRACAVHVPCMTQHPGDQRIDLFVIRRKLLRVSTSPAVPLQDVLDDTAFVQSKRYLPRWFYDSEGAHHLSAGAKLDLVRALVTLPV